MKFATYNLRTLSRGAVLKRFFYLREEIENFMKKKGKPVLEFQSSEWMQNLAFMVDITQHLSNLNKMLQGRKRLGSSLLLAIHNKPLWSARWLAIWNNWLAVWFRFEDQVCLGELEHILPVSFSRLPKATSLPTKVLCVFGTTYLCEQVFSVINISAHTWSLKWHLENGCYTGFDTWYWYTSES